MESDEEDDLTNQHGNRNLHGHSQKDEEQGSDFENDHTSLTTGAKRTKKDTNTSTSRGSKRGANRTKVVTRRGSGYLS